MVTTRSHSKTADRVRGDNARTKPRKKIEDALVVAFLAGSAIVGATFGTGQKSFIVQADPAVKAAQAAIASILGAIGLEDAHELELYGRLVVILPTFFTVSVKQCDRQP